MRLMICSTEDVASVNIRDRLLERGEWEEAGTFEGSHAWKRGEDLLVTIQETHIFSDHVDRRVRDSLGADPDTVIFLSRHKAASGIHTLTVHPIGNHTSADFGGKEATLVPAAPRQMTGLLRTLYRKAEGLEFKVSFEVTHHGPYLETPSIFIEIGSSEETWGHRGAAEAIAATLLDQEVPDHPVSIGLGGGHYAPRFSDMALGKRVCFGHMIPTYALKAGGRERIPGMVSRACEASGGAGMAYLHKKSLKRAQTTELRHLLEDMGIQVVDSKGLEDL
ncbi:MAG: D-aminoacyl-tRNA deacylase [Methanomassiliicoccales archaeon]